ncbi:MAG TPA: VanZ family protein [Thermoanaerobaculia bacterium]
MDKRRVRVIVVRKWVTITLLVIVSAAMAALLYWLSGKAYATGREPFRELVVRLMQRTQPVSRNVVLASLMPVTANILFFLPWGFLLFLAIDSPSRPRSRAYLTTLIAGALFALSMELWQNFLPTRVTTVPDTAANTLGAVAGAAAGHLRKRIRIQFDY